MGISVPEQDNIALLMDDVQRIRKQFTSSIPVLMTRNQAKFAYKLAMETIVSEISIDMAPSQRKTCGICFNDDFKAEHMFSVDLCGHQFCVECMTQYIKVRLLEESEMRCPHYQCESKLTVVRCANLLTPELREMWEHRSQKESVVVADKAYCQIECAWLLCQMEFRDGALDVVSLIASAAKFRGITTCRASNTRGTRGRVYILLQQCCESVESANT